MSLGDTAATTAPVENHQLTGDKFRNKAEIYAHMGAKQPTLENLAQVVCIPYCPLAEKVHAHSAEYC